MKESSVLLSTTYFGPIQWYQKLYRYPTVYLDRGEPFQKQSFRNRCVILTANGLQALSIPTKHSGESQSVGDLRLSNHGRWQHQHWQALQSAYGDAPFFDYYSDDIRRCIEAKTDKLFDFNLEITATVCRLLDIVPNIQIADRTDKMKADDHRNSIHPKRPQSDNDFLPRRYWQVFEQRYGFQSNLSILDLLFCCGPETLLFL